MLSSTHEYSKTMVDATAQHWTAGIREGGRGIRFLVKFYQLQEEIPAEKLVVNQIPMDVEVTKVGDTTYVTSFFHTTEENHPKLVNDPQYNGTLNLNIEEVPTDFKVGEFRIIQSTLFP